MGTSMARSAMGTTMAAIAPRLSPPPLLDAVALWAGAAVVELWLLVVVADEGVLSGVDDFVAKAGTSVTKMLCPGAGISGGIFEKLESSGGI